MLRLRVLYVLLIIAALITPQPARAIGTIDTTFLSYPPLLITAYQTTGDGKDLQYIELFNASNEMVAVQDWTLFDVENARTLKFTTTYAGMLEPQSHTVISGHVAASKIVPQASFEISGWSAIGKDKVIKSLQIQRPGYRSLDANFSAKTAEFGLHMIRTYNTDSYSTAASPFLENNRDQASLLSEDGLYSAPDNPAIEIVEIYPYASDCSPFDVSVLCGDYIKLYNQTSSVVSLDDIVLRTDSSSSSRTTSNAFTLGGSMNPGEYKTIWLTDAGARISLTNSGGYVWLEDTYGLVAPYAGSVVRYEPAGSALRGYSYAEASDGTWQWSSTPSPLGKNTITTPVEAPCAEGKYRNPETNRCRSLEETLNVLTTCDEGSERNPLTNRCRKIASSATGTLTPCKEGQERNPATNRCRSIASAIAELLPCNEGYERNPATNRCRKIAGRSVLGAEYPVEPYDQGQGSSITWWVVGGIGALALGYAGWEWRREIATALAKIRSKFISS